MTSTLSSLTLIAAAGFASLAGCAQRTALPAPSLGMANPASVYCVQLGGMSQIQSSSSGEQGICKLPDGQAIEEWTLYRRDHR